MRRIETRRWTMYYTGKPEWRISVDGFGTGEFSEDFHHAVSVWFQQALIDGFEKLLEKPCSHRCSCTLKSIYTRLDYVDTRSQSRRMLRTKISYITSCTWKFPCYDCINWDLGIRKSNRIENWFVVKQLRTKIITINEINCKVNVYPFIWTTVAPYFWKCSFSKQISVL